MHARRLGLAPLVGREGRNQRLLDSVVERIPGVGVANEAALGPLLEVIQNDADDVCGCVMVLEGAAEHDADGTEPALASVGGDDAPRLALREPADRLRAVRDVAAVSCHVEPERRDAVQAAEHGGKAAVMEEHGARLQRIPPMAPKAGPCPDGGRRPPAGCVDRGLDPPARQHEPVKVLQLVRDRAPQLVGVEAEAEFAALFGRVQRGGPAAVGLEPLGAHVKHAAACRFLNTAGAHRVHS